MIRYTGRYFHDLYFRLFTNRQMLGKIRAGWGHEVKRERNFKHISLFHRLTTKPEAVRSVDDKTWYDLNMDSVFEKIDRNISCLGSQYLYSLLRTYAADATLTSQFRQYEYFAQNPHIRESVLLQLSKLGHEETWSIPNIVCRKAPSKPRGHYLVYLSSLVTLGSSALIIFNSIFIFPTITLIILNLLISHFYGRRVAGYFPDISNLSAMLEVGIKLSKLTDANISQFEELRQLRGFCRALKKKIGWLAIDESRLDDLSRTIVAYFNYFYLFNLVSFVRSIHFINSQQDKIQDVYKLIASLDAAISIASYLESLPYYCRPQFNQTNTLNVVDMFHPLLSDPVANSFQMANTSALITGSNMAGKTTFLKTIGLNIILGQSLAICLAMKAQLPRSMVKTSIQIVDNIQDNKSYYFQEIEAILEFIRLAAGKGSYVFLIDEIFRGTNTIERIAAATSVLKHLCQNSLSLVTTHDIELQKLLAEDFVMHHFSEQIENGKHFFDYLIKKGPTSSRNAIHLLELKGYPEDVVRDAYELAARLARDNDW